MKAGRPHRPMALLLAALALAALLPAVCVLWFMNAAMRNERLAVQEQMADVYLKHLASLRRQIGAFWMERQAALQDGPGSAAEQFAAIIRGDLADAVVIYDRARRPLYPNAVNPEPLIEGDASWMVARELEFQRKNYAAAAEAYAQIANSTADIHSRARALQSEAACWLKAGDQPAALVRLARFVSDPSLRPALGAQGTLLVPNAQLLILTLLQPPAVQKEPLAGSTGGGPAGELWHRTLHDLVNRLNDYSGADFPSSQRRFLMRELKTIAPAVVLPTHAAEDLAADYLGANAPPPTEARLQRTPLAGVWRFASTDRPVLALHREERLKADMAKSFEAAALPDVRVRLLAPGEPFAASKMVPPQDAGEAMPGWRITLTFPGGDPLAEASARQTRFYLWTGFLVVAIIALLGLLVARYVSAQMRLARLKNELVSTVSHELKTPLASMRALVDTLSAGRYQDEQQLRDYLKLIGKENQRLSQLIENFLTFSRLERGKQPFRFETLAPAAVVATAVDSLAEKLGPSQCHFESSIPPDLPPVRGDADALSTVLINLLDNACKYSAGDKRIRVSAYARNSFVCFEVADNGVGLNAADAKRIFDRFYQADQSLTRQRGGCGLGLSIVQSIVRAHGGTVEVESEPGKGSTFRVRIPVSELKSQSIVTESTEAGPRRQSPSPETNSVISVSPP